MSKKTKDVISEGLSGLLSGNTNEVVREIRISPVYEDEDLEEEETDNKPKRYRQRKGNKTVCYSIPAEMIAAIKHIALYEGRKVNEVVVDAFAQYLQSWDGSRRVPSKREWINNLNFDGWNL